MRLSEEIRATEMPGKRGGDFFYAQAIYGYFDEIEKLRAEGFTLTTICKFLEKKGMLPTDSDPRSFRRAFRRESVRRQRSTSMEVKVQKRMKVKETISKREFLDVSMKPKQEIAVTPAKPKKSSSGPQINPDNTFKIAPIDPDDLPDMQ